LPDPPGMDQIGIISSNIQIGANQTYYPISTYNLPPSLTASGTTYPTTATVQPQNFPGWSNVVPPTAPNGILISGFRGMVRVLQSSTTIYPGVPLWTRSPVLMFIGTNQNTNTKQKLEFSKRRTIKGQPADVVSYLFDVDTDGVIFVNGYAQTAAPSGVPASTPQATSWAIDFNPVSSITSAFAFELQINGNPNHSLSDRLQTLKNRNVFDVQEAHVK